MGTRAVRRSSGPSRLSPTTRTNVIAIAAASCFVAALAAASPVGVGPTDRLWCALAGALVPLVASRARRAAVLWMGGVTAVIAMGGDATTIATGIVLLALIVVTAFSHHREPVTNAAIGALTIQILLRGPSYGPIIVPLIVAAAALAPVAWSAWRATRGRQRRIIAWTLAVVSVAVLVITIGMTVTVLDARTSIQRATEDATNGLTLLGQGQTEQATAMFERSSREFAAASSTLGSVTTWPGRALPIAAENLRALRVAASSGVDLASTAARTASSADYRGLTINAGRLDLARIDSLEEPIAQSLETMTSALTAVEAARSAWLLPPVGSAFDHLVDRLSSTRQQADIALQGIRVAPQLLGADGEKRYFLSFGSPGESRNGGGFVGAFGILVADRGKLTLDRSGPITDLYRRTPPLYSFDPPAHWEERYSTYTVRVNLGNQSASPSWPVDAGVIGQFYPQAPGGAPIDGAIYADPAALAGLLSLTGPIEVAGIHQKLNSNNVETYLLRDQYVEFANDSSGRKDVLGDVSRATFEALTSRPLPNLTKMANVLGPLVDAGHLRVSVFDAAPETFLDRIGISGQWSITPGSDYLSVRSANLLNNKIDTYLTRTIDIETRIDEPTGILHSTVTVELRNDAPPSGLPPYLIGNNRDLPDGTNRSLVTLYTPHTLQSVTIDGQPAGAQTQQEFGGPVYGVVAEIAPQSTLTIRFELTGTAPSKPYRLEVLPQATANPDLLTVRTGNPSDSTLRTQYDGPLRRIIRIGPE